MYKIHTLNKISADGLANFDAAKYDCTAGIDDADAVIVRSASMHEIDIPSNVLAIARAGAGTNNIPIDACTDKGIVVFNTPGANANAVTELVICSLFLTSRKITAGIDWCKTLKGSGADVGKLVEKGKGQFVGPEIKGKTLGLIGLGAIGILTANAACALGMHIIGYDPFITDKAKAELCECVKITDNLDDIFTKSDYISLHAPLNDNTKGMINAGVFAKAKDGVRVLNFARAELADSGALLDALKTGKCAAYATDFPTDDQLGTDGVVAIPHLGASTPESEENCAAMAVAELRGFLENGNIVNSVNLPGVEVEKGAGDRLTVISKEDMGDKISAALFGALSAKVVSNITKVKKAAYTVIDVDGAIDEAAVEAVKALDGVLAVRVIK